MSLSTPRTIPLSTLIFKTFAGLGAGLLGTVILLIFVFTALATTKATQAVGPFFAFTTFVMGLITSLTTNSLAIIVFSFIDREKYPRERQTLLNVAYLNLIIFVCLLPVYLAASIHGAECLFMIVALQLVLTAQASIFALELSSGTEPRDHYLAIYGITFGMVGSIVLDLFIYNLFSSISQTHATSGGGTALLLAVLPITWFSFGFATTTTEMIYRWIYRTYGGDYLNRTDNDPQNV